MRETLCVGLGGAMGAVARLMLGELYLIVLPGRFPFGTLLINVIGSFCLSALLTLFVMKDINKHIRLGCTTGFMGGFTTFSAFCRESVFFLTSGQATTALIYIGLSLFLGLAAIYGGNLSVRRMVSSRIPGIEYDEAAE